MKECVNCKALLEDDELFCHECGTKQEIKEEKDNTEESIASEVKFCIHCGVKIEADSTFCPFCGKPQETEEVKADEPQANKSEKEETQTEQSAKEESSKEEPKVEEPKAEEPKVEESQPEESKPDEETTYEWEEEKKSRTWIWALNILLIAGVAGWYFFMRDTSSYEAEEDTTEVEEITADNVEDEAAPASALAFLEQFYKGEYGDEGFIEQNVTANVLNKLKRDYPYDCETNDCLADWVFTAYPPGADLNLEEGPIITKTDTEGKFKVEFKYSGYNGNQKAFETRTVYLVVTQIDGQYLISDYEIEYAEDKEYEERPDPEFPDGESALNEYISSNLRYPASAEQNGIDGKVIVQFLVNEEGELSEFSIHQSADPDLDNEALRLVKNMPNWTPASNKNGPVKSYVRLPIVFRINP